MSVTDPQMIVGGFHNADLSQSIKRLEKGKQYRDLTTVCVIPTRGVIPARVVETWMGLMSPMNNAFFRIFVERAEVGEAYNAAVDWVLQAAPSVKYMLTLEEDNMPPPDGLLKLFESIANYGAVGGLYWTKGEMGQPMIYGDPNGLLSFQPQTPVPDTVQECNGLGMGFTLFNMNVFRDETIPRPWFKTVQEWSPERGGQAGTQDLYFFANARKAGWKFACDTRVKVGHYDLAGDFVW